MDKLPHIGDTLPKSWIEVRQKLESLKTQNYISFTRYKAICAQFDLDEKQATYLSHYYHDLGVVLHFQDNPILRNTVYNIESTQPGKRVVVGWAKAMPCPSFYFVH